VITQTQLATLLTSRSARGGFLAASGHSYPPAWVDQLEITAQIVTCKRQEAVARWFPSTVALCRAVPALRDPIERFCDEPVPIHGPDRRIRCGEALAAALRSATAGSRLGSAVGEVLRLETEIVRLTYEPPAESARSGGPSPPGNAVAAPSTPVRLAGGVRVLRFALDVLMLWERPADMAPVVASPPPQPFLDRPVAVALVRRPALQPVRAVRLGPGSADLLEACAGRQETVEALLGSLGFSQREAALRAIGQAIANGLLVSP
jgi:hypothetical protein